MKGCWWRSFVKSKLYCTRWWVWTEWMLCHLWLTSSPLFPSKVCVFFAVVHEYLRGREKLRWREKKEGSEWNFLHKFSKTFFLSFFLFFLFFNERRIKKKGNLVTFRVLFYSKVVWIQWKMTDKMRGPFSTFLSFFTLFLKKLHRYKI